MERKKVIEMNTIKMALAYRGVTSTELAKYLGVNPVTVSSWCTNKIQPDLRNFYLIANYLDVKVSTLLRPTDDVIEEVKKWHEGQKERKAKK